MTTDIELKDIVIFGVLIVLIAIVFYYFYKKNASTQAKITQLHNLLNYQQTLIGQSNQSNSAMNHEIKMLKSLFKNKENVEITVSCPKGKYLLRSCYMVACDGADSPTRKRMNLSFEGEIFDEHFLTSK